MVNTQLVRDLWSFGKVSVSFCEFRWRSPSNAELVSEHIRYEVIRNHAKSYKIIRNHLKQKKIEKHQISLKKQTNLGNLWKSFGIVVCLLVDPECLSHVTPVF